MPAITQFEDMHILNRPTKVVEHAWPVEWRNIAKRHVCDTCKRKCKGGCLDYVSVRVQHRHGCADHQACAKVWAERRFGKKKQAA